MEKIKSYGGFGAFVQIDGLTFSQFSSQTKCGAKQSAFKLNNDASDYIPKHEFENTVFNNVEDSALAFFRDPPKAWATLDDCVGFPCTAP